MFDYSNPGDVFDSRDVIERIEELELEREEGAILEVELKELAALREFADKAENVSDWHYGETFVADDYFTEYTKELIQELGYLSNLPSDGSWPYNHVSVDYEAAAEELKQDYNDFTLNGLTYWAR